MTLSEGANTNLLLDHFLSMYNVFVWCFNDWLHRITACPFRPQPQEKHHQMSQNRKKRQHSIKDKRKVSTISFNLSIFSLSFHRTLILGAKLVQEMFPLVFLWLGSGLVLLNSGSCHDSVGSWIITDNCSHQWHTPSGWENLSKCLGEVRFAVMMLGFTLPFLRASVSQSPFCLVEIKLSFRIRSGLKFGLSWRMACSVVELSLVAWVTLTQ